jgi:hypothetical protein
MLVITRGYLNYFGAGGLLILGHLLQQGLGLLIFLAVVRWSHDGKLPMVFTATFGDEVKSEGIGSSENRIWYPGKVPISFLK